jgi:hypothetical protein
MIGAMATVALLAVLASALATLSNMTIAREFPTYRTRQEVNIDDFVIDQAIRLSRYQQTATLFYREALVLWAALALMLGATFLWDLAH